MLFGTAMTLGEVDGYRVRFDSSARPRAVLGWVCMIGVGGRVICFLSQLTSSGDLVFRTFWNARSDV